MKYFIKKSEIFDALDVQQKENSLLVTKSGKEYRVSIEKFGKNQYSVMINNQSQIVTAEIAKNTIRLVMNHAEYRVPVLNQRQKMEAEMFGSAEENASGGDIAAPMPGLILRVEVKTGQIIEAGQPLLVMEAMKMENEIRASESGVIEEVLVLPQQAVEKDDVMIRMGKI